MDVETALQLKPHEEGLSVKIIVQPRASCNRAVGLRGDALKIKLTAPPVDGAATNACLKFLAKALDISRSRLAILAGETQRTKIVRVRPDPEDPHSARHIRQRLLALARS